MLLWLNGASSTANCIITMKCTNSKVVENIFEISINEFSQFLTISVLFLARKFKYILTVK